MQTNRIVTGLALAVMLGGCGNGTEQAATTEATEAAPAATVETAPAPEAAAPPAASAPPAEEAASAAAPPTTPPAGDDAALTYEPIDTSKLENSWYEQYSAGQ